ncbi:MAG: condensation domain-containing protein, partial [Chloroflexota bacterium]
LGGVGLARGYFGQPELTAARFVPNPFGAVGGERLYRTGDLCRYLPDGNIVYLGRLDHQVKLRGFRIELGEIEVALGACAGVRECVVAARGEGGEMRLVAYLVGVGEAMPDAAALRAALKERLPEYMLPSAYVFMETLPLTPSGKVDRRALPSVDAPQSGVDYVAPRTAEEATLAALWEGVLGVERVGIHDNFFGLGGHSLLAIALIERMRAAGLHTDVRTLFAQPTIAELAGVVNAGRDEVAVPANGIPAECRAITPEMLPLVTLTGEEIAHIVESVAGGVGNVQDIYPLSPLQEGILFHHLVSGEGDPYVLPVQFAFESRERLDGFVWALQRVIERHDILRTAVLWESVREPVQVVLRCAPLLVEEVALEGAVSQELRARCDPHRYRLDVREAPLMRAFVAQDAAAGRWLLQLVFHHLVADHTTLDVIVSEIRVLLAGGEKGLPPAVPFRNFVAQARLGVSPAAHEAFFREMLSDVDEPTAPFGLLDVRGDGMQVDEAHLEVSGELAVRLRNEARRLGVSVASLLHLAWARVLAMVSGRPDVVFGTVLFGRMQGWEGAGRMVGMFINTLPVRIPVGAQGVQESARQTHSLLMRLLRHEHASLSLAQRCSGVKPPVPLFSALLNYRHTGSSEDGAAVQGLEGVQIVDGEERTNYPLVLSVDDLGEGFTLAVQASAPVSAERVCGYVCTVLAHLVQALETAPGTPVNVIEALPLAERQRLLVEWNATRAEFPQATCLHELFEAQAERTPQAVALVFDGVEMRYGELDARANQLAHYLQALGVGAESLVGILVERSLDMVVGLLGILKAGGTYVPLDPHYPAERLAYMLADAAPRVLLAQQHLLPAQGVAGVQTVCLDADWPRIVQESAQRLPPAASAEDLAYV